MTKQNNQLIAERLQWLSEKYGRLTPAIVVKDARDPRSPLNKKAGFQWNVNKAAYASWIEHARELIASVEITVRRIDRTFVSQAYVRDPRVPPKEQGYISVTDLMSDKDTARQAMDYEIKRVLALMDRVRMLAEVLGLQKNVDAMVEDMRRLQTSLAA